MQLIGPRKSHLGAGGGDQQTGGAGAGECEQAVSLGARGHYQRREDGQRGFHTAATVPLGWGYQYCILDSTIQRRIGQILSSSLASL